MFWLTNNYILSKEELKLVDLNSFQFNKIPPVLLMEEAAEKVLNQLSCDFDLLKEKICILAGFGNNGGDALSLARKLFFQEIFADIYVFKDKTGSALYEQQKEILSSLNINLIDISELKEKIFSYTLIIDGIFGIGYKLKEDKEIERIFSLLNEGDAKIVSIDIPSGLNTENLNSVNADYTYSIGFLKKDFFNITTRKKVGKIKDLKISLDLKNCGYSYEYFYIRHMAKPHKKLNDFVHKYSRGGCISIGGSKGKIGAIIFSGEASIRSGSGIGLVITEEENIDLVNLSSKNLIVDTVDNIGNYIDKYKTVIIGPGLAFKNSENIEKIRKIFSLKKQFILDASFFSIFDKSVLADFAIPPILTPHSKEFKDFFKEESSNLNTNTMDIVSKVSKKYNCYIILKDSFLTIGTKDGKVIIYDNPCRILAQAGSGDILSGILGGILSQDYSCEEGMLESIRIFYEIAEFLKKSGYKSYEPEYFIDLIGKEVIL